MQMVLTANVCFSQTYITTKSKYLGPNALPVPDIKNGTLIKESYIQLGVEKHTSTGDNTENLYAALYTPLYSKRVGLQINIVPIEHYKMDSITRVVRYVRNVTGEGIAGGDFYIGTYIQLIENNAKLPDVLLTINLRTASGTNVADARYTDTPGYFFDVSFGKKYFLNKARTCFIKPSLMFGFYCWQNLGDLQKQDDAFLYGARLDLMFSKVDFVNSLGGYDGYVGDGDKPMVYRARLKSNSNRIFNYEIKFEKGLHDYPYTSFRLSTFITLSKIF